MACRRSTRQRRDVDYTEEQHSSQPEAVAGIHYQEVGTPAINSSSKQAAMYQQRGKRLCVQQMPRSHCLEACLQLRLHYSSCFRKGCLLVWSSSSRLLSCQAAIWSSSCLPNAEKRCVGAPAEVNRDQQQPLHVSPHWDLVRLLWDSLVADNPMWLSTMLCGEPDWTHRGVTGLQNLLQELAGYGPVGDPGERNGKLQQSRALY